MCRQFTGLSYTEFRELTWRQVALEFERGLEHQVRYVLPLHYQADPKDVMKYLNDGPRSRAADEEKERNRARTKHDFARKLKEMDARARHNRVDAETLRKLDEVRRQL